jgi:hypothetical protein
MLLNVRGLVVEAASPRRCDNEGSLEQQRRLGYLVESNE